MVTWLDARSSDEWTSLEKLKGERPSHVEVPGYFVNEATYKRDRCVILALGRSVDAEPAAFNWTCIPLGMVETIKRVKAPK